MSFAVPQITTTLPILTSKAIQTKAACSRFPVNRIYCIGRNYREHAIEMGHDPDREPPFFFQKPSDAAVEASSTSCIIPVSVTLAKFSQSIGFSIYQLIVAF